MTPHIQAKKNEITKIVLMPGDPLRAKYIANKFLKKVKKVNNIRNMYIYTGYYNKMLITVAGSGMGCPSIGIYSYELFKFYDVDTIIRIGTCGSYTKRLKVNDVINVNDSYSESSYAKIAGNLNTNEMASQGEIKKLISTTANELKIKIYDDVKAHSSDVFYSFDHNLYKKLLKENNTEVVEMESFALFTNAKILNKNAACILTVSDSFEETEYKLSAKDRERNLNNMIKLALHSCLKIK